MVWKTTSAANQPGMVFTCTVPALHRGTAACDKASLGDTFSFRPNWVTLPQSETNHLFFCNNARNIDVSGVRIAPHCLSFKSPLHLPVSGMSSYIVSFVRKTHSDICAHILDWFFLRRVYVALADLEPTK